MAANSKTSNAAVSWVRRTFSRRRLMVCICFLASYGAISASADPTPTSARASQEQETPDSAGKCDDAIPAAERVLALRQKEGPADGPEIITLMGNVARLYTCAGRIEDGFDLTNKLALLSVRPLDFDDITRTIKSPIGAAPSVGSRIADVARVHLNRPLAAPSTPGAPQSIVAPVRDDDADRCVSIIFRKPFRLENCQKAIAFGGANRGELFRSRGELFASAGNYDSAIADLTEAIRLNPRDAEAFEKRGSAENIVGEYDLAISDETKAIDLDPRNAAAFADRGVAYQRTYDPVHAKADFDSAIRLDPNLAAAFVARGGLARSAGDFPQAIADFSEAIRVDPGFASAYMQRWRANEAWGRIEVEDSQRAISAYKNMLRVDPDDYSALIGLGDAYAALQDHESAAKSYSEAIRVAPAQGGAYLSRSRAYRELGKQDLQQADEDRALSIYTSVIAAHPRRANAYLGRASIYADQKKYELAIADYSTVIGLRPRDASALVQRAVTFQRISTTTSSRLAYADLILALQIDPNNPLALFQRGALFEGSDELDFALADYKTLAKVYPTYSRGVGAVERVERKLAARRQKP